MRGVNTHISPLKISIAWTTNLKNILNTRSAATSLLRMRDIILQNFLARDKIFIPARQSTSAA